MNNRNRTPIHDPADSILILEGVSAAFAEREIKIGPGLSVVAIDRDFIRELEGAGVPNLEDIVRDSRVSVKGTGTSSTADLMRPHAVARALILTSDCRIAPRHIIIDKGSHGLPPSVTVGPSDDKSVLWGHFRNLLTLDDVQSAEKMWPRIEQHILPHSFSRISNAVLFYNNGYTTGNADLALVAFVTCWESLFSTGEQELTFRLSLRLATFLEDHNARRETLFDECKDVYSIRSKVVHGAAIDRNSEQAAIHLVESVVPSAEKLARRALVKIFEMGLESIFNNPSKISALFNKLLFSSSLQEALSAISFKSHHLGPTEPTKSAGRKRNG